MACSLWWWLGCQMVLGGGIPRTALGLQLGDERHARVKPVAVQVPDLAGRRSALQVDHALGVIDQVNRLAEDLPRAGELGGFLDLAHRCCAGAAADLELDMWVGAGV